MQIILCLGNHFPSIVGSNSKKIEKKDHQILSGGQTFATSIIVQFVRVYWLDLWADRYIHVFECMFLRLKDWSQPWNHLVFSFFSWNACRNNAAAGAELDCRTLISFVILQVYDFRVTRPTKSKRSYSMNIFNEVEEQAQAVKAVWCSI